MIPTTHGTESVNVCISCYIIALVNAILSWGGDQEKCRRLYGCIFSFGNLVNLDFVLLTFNFCALFYSRFSQFLSWHCFNSFFPCTIGRNSVVNQHTAISEKHAFVRQRFYRGSQFVVENTPFVNLIFQTKMVNKKSPKENLPKINRSM